MLYFRQFKYLLFILPLFFSGVSFGFKTKVETTKYNDTFLPEFTAFLKVGDQPLALVCPYYLRDIKPCFQAHTLDETQGKKNKIKRSRNSNSSSSTDTSGTTVSSAFSGSGNSTAIEFSPQQLETKVLKVNSDQLFALTPNHMNADGQTRDTKLPDKVVTYGNSMMVHYPNHQLRIWTLSETKKEESSNLNNSATDSMLAAKGNTKLEAQDLLDMAILDDIAVVAQRNTPLLVYRKTDNQWALNENNSELPELSNGETVNMLHLFKNGPKKYLILCSKQTLEIFQYNETNNTWNSENTSQVHTGTWTIYACSDAAGYVLVSVTVDKKPQLAVLKENASNEWGLMKIEALTEVKHPQKLMCCVAGEGEEGKIHIFTASGKSEYIHPVSYSPKSGLFNLEQKQIKLVKTIKPKSCKGTRNNGCNIR